MAAAAGIRSMATKMSPHRLIAARGLHSSGVGSASEHLAAQDSKLMKHQFIATTNTCIAVLVFGSCLFYTFVKPRLNKLEDRADTLSGEVFNLKQEIIKLKDIKDQEAQSMETSGPKSTS